MIYEALQSELDRSVDLLLAMPDPEPEVISRLFGCSEEEVVAALIERYGVLESAAKTTDWRHVHKVADEFEPAVRAVAQRAFDNGRTALNVSQLRSAVESQDERKVYSLVSSAIEATRSSLEEDLADLLADVRDAAGAATAKSLNKRLSKALRAAAPQIGGFAFDKANPKAVEWAKNHAADVIDDISDTTREGIRDLIEEAFQADFDADELTAAITDLIGDAERAELIARTETMRASNEGQQEAWDQAVEDGLLTGNEQQEWIVTPDDRLCPICEPLDGVTTDLDGTFDVDGEQIEGPPAHPRCRCTLGLKLDS